MSDGLYVACWLTPEQAQRLAVPGGEPEQSLHMTLCYIGDIAALPSDAGDTANEALTVWARETAPIIGSVSGVGRFVSLDGDCIYASIDAPALPTARQRLWDMLTSAGLKPDDTHGFSPHVTLAYVARSAPTAITAAGLALPQPIRFDTVTICSPSMPPRAGVPLRGDSPGVVRIAKRAFPVLVRKADTVEEQIGSVADTFKPDGGYGGVAWNPETKTVFWQGADWTSVEDHDAARDAFLAIPGVEHFDGEAEASLPTSGSWRVVRKAMYPMLVRAHVRGGQLEAGVATELDRYFQTRPDRRAHEAADHGFDPICEPARYLAAERAEGGHSSLNGSGPVTVETLTSWEREEDTEPLDHVEKEQPDASQVHIDSASGTVSVANLQDEDDDDPLHPRKPKRVEAAVKLLKADDEQRIVYGIVLEPDTEDSQGDVVSKDDVELAAHRFLYAQALIGDQHRKLAPLSVRPVQSYVAPCDFTLGGQVVKAGSWVLAAHVPDPELWAQVKKGEKAAWSVAGSGVRTPLSQ